MIYLKTIAITWSLTTLILALIWAIDEFLL